MMKIYDLLVGMKSPVKTIRLCENGLRAIIPHEEGNLVAVGSDMGNVYLVESSEALTTNMRNDKSLLTTVRPFHRTRQAIMGYARQFGLSKRPYLVIN